MTKQELPLGLNVYFKGKHLYAQDVDPARCAASVSDSAGWHSSQCQNRWKVEKRGHHWCGIHDPDKVEERQAKTNAKWQAKQDARNAPFIHVKELEAEVAQLKRLIIYAGGILAHGTPGSAWVDWVMRVQGLLGIEFHEARFKNGNAIPFKELRDSVKDMPRVTVKKLFKESNNG